MREIEFRAWKKSEKRYVYWEELCRDAEILKLALTRIMFETLEQFTGFLETTARKKKIYENDKVKCRFWNQIWHEDIVIVKFDPFDGYNLPTSFGGKDHTWEVIGNIHDKE